MARIQLPDGSHICQWPEGPGAFFSHTSEELEEIVRKLRPNSEDPVGMAGLRVLLAAEHDELAVREMGDEAVLFEAAGHIKSGRLLWSAGVLAAKGGGGGGKKEEPKPPPPPPKPKDEVLVTPFLEVEMRVVLFDRGLEKHLSDPKYPAQPTWIRLAMRQSPHEPKFKKGGKLKVDGAGAVEAYEDEKLTKKFDLSAPIPIDKLTKSDPLTLWLKGKTKGKFELKFEVDGAAAPFKADKPATAKMGVVEVQFKLHDQDLDEIKKVQVDPDTDTYHNDLKAKALPEQKELSDEDKIKKGRFLHVQNAGHHGRAKLILKKLAASEWPDGTDAYELVLTSSESAEAKKTNTALDALDKETEGASKNTVTVAAAKAADVTLWVEGKTASKKALDTRLDLGVGGDGNKKRNGDWARFTIVKIKEVTILASSDTKKGGQFWHSVDKRFYINTAATPQGRELKDDPGIGKKVKITAKLTAEIPKVQIHFMLAGSKENIDVAKWTTNFKYGKLDKALKAVDKKDRKDVIHLFAETDAKGAVVMDKLVLSRLGGEKYKIGAYIAQDPHLAKYVDGHADLEKRKPFLGDEFQVWRRVWAQLTYNKSLALPARDKVGTEYKNLFVEYKEIDEKKFDKSSVAGLVEHPKWQFDPGGGEGKIICVGGHNKAKFHGLFKAPSADHTPKSHLILCDVQWDPKTSAKMTFDSGVRPAPWTCTDDDGETLGVVKPSLSGGALVVGGKWEWNDGATDHDGTLADDDIIIEKTRADPGDFKVKIPTKCPGTCKGCGGGTAIDLSAADVSIELKLNAAEGPFNGESGAPHCLIRVWPGYFSTICHEIGHQFNEVRQVKNWLGLPNHPDQYIRRGGVGSHCKKGATEHATAKDKDGNSILLNGTCWMYHSGTPSRTAWCSNCKTDLRVRNLTKFKLDD